MGVATDKSLQGLTTAVNNISTSGMSDSTGQAINSTLGTLMTNTTGQAINTTLQSLVGAISPAAANVTFDNTGTGLSASNVQALGVELNSNKVSTSTYAWKFLGQKTGSVAIDLPATWTELIIQVHPTSNANLNTLHLYGMQTNTLVNAGLGSFGTSYAVGQVSRTQAKLLNCVWGGSDVTSSTITYYYYR